MQLSAPSIPQELKSPNDGNFAPQWVASALDLSDLNKIAAFAERTQSSITDVLLGSWQSLLWRLSGQLNFATGACLRDVSMRSYKAL